VAIAFDNLNRSAPSSIYIAFPELKKLAQEHFGCPTLPGAPADVGSFASHFKQRVMGVSGVWGRRRAALSNIADTCRLEPAAGS
jgi:hypothetical protein